MSFWRTFGFQPISAIDNILDRESYTLEELLDEDDLVTETKSQNKKLLEFLIQPQTLSKLFEYLTKEAEENADTKRKLKYPFLACEILSSEVWLISESVYGNEAYLDQLYTFLDKDPINPVLATYSAKVAASLLQRKITETIEYLKKKDHIIDKFMRHLGNATVMELLLKVVSCEDTPEGQGSGILQWLSEQNLITALVSKFAPGLEDDVHENAAQALMEIINLSMKPENHQTAYPLLSQLESEETLKQLCDYALSAESISSLQHGLNVLIVLLRRNTNNGDQHYTQADLPAIFRVLLDNLDRFRAIVAINKDVKTMETTFGELTPPFGFERLKIMEFFVALLRTNQHCVDEVLIRTNLVGTCLDLFFFYKWNNFLHSIIEQMLRGILEGPNEDLKLSLFTQCTLAERIADAAKENEEESNKPKGIRRGYMGHLTSISILILKVAASNEAVHKILDESSSWNEYVNGPLAETRNIENKQLGGHRPLFSEGIAESEDDLDMDERGNTELVNVFTQYLVQQGFTSEFPEEFAHENDNYDDDGEIVFDGGQPYDPVYNVNEKKFEMGFDDESEDDSEDESEEDEYEDSEEDYEAEKTVGVGEEGEEVEAEGEVEPLAPNSNQVDDEGGQ